MKSTLKVVLCISLFLSTALLTLADGEIGQGNRCTTNCSSAPEPIAMQSFEAEPVTDLNVQNSPSATTKKESTIILEDSLLEALKKWFLGLLG